MPKNVVTIGNEVTIICEDPSNAQEYPLYIKGYPDSQLTTSHQDTEEKDKIFISSIESHNAGQYSCFYKSPAGISEQSDTLELIVTGEKTFPEHWDLFLGKEYINCGVIFQSHKRRYNVI